MKRLFLLLALCSMVAVGCTEQPGGENEDENSIFITDSNGNVVVEAEGGEVVVTVTTNIEYSVEIPEEAQSWLSVADTRTEVRNEKLTFTVAANETFEERSATVNLCAKGGDILQTITIKQNKSNAISCANNEVIYTTKYGYPIELNITEGFGGDLMSHTYENGYGRISFDNDVVSIPNEAFKDCTTLTTIVLPNSLSTIDSSAFRGCNSLTSVTIGNGVTSIGNYAFLGCFSLTSVYITDIAAWCNISVDDYFSNPLYYAGNLYLNNELVTDLIIPDSVTSIGDYAFGNCKSLTSVTIPDSVTLIGIFAFRGCNSLTSVTIGNGVTKIEDRAFCACDSLKEVYCKPTTPPTGRYNMFYYNAWDRTIYVPRNSLSAYKSASGWSDYASDIVGYDF